MVKPGTDLWEDHPAVPTGERLSFGERAADVLKHYFGTWTALFVVFGWIAAWILAQHLRKFDPYPFILLNLCLSCVAAVQGIILQISANRGDRISGQVAAHTEKNTDALLSQSATLLELQQQQMQILGEVRGLRAEHAQEHDRDCAYGGSPHPGGCFPGA